MLLINAASSIINRDSASERVASPADETALHCEPLTNLSESRLSSSVSNFSHDGKFSYITLTLVTRFFAVFCVVAITRIFLSEKNVINHKEYPAANVEIPNCRDFKMIL